MEIKNKEFPLKESRDINRFLNNLGGFDDSGIVDDEMIEWFGQEPYDKDALDISCLKGFEFSVAQFGTHKHDGQTVDYTFVFTDPDGHRWELITEMNLVAGWNVKNKDIQYIGQRTSNTQIILKDESIVENVITFHINMDTDAPEEIVRFSSNGDIFIKGKLVENDQQVVEGFREFLRRSGTLE